MVQLLAVSGLVTNIASTSRKPSISSVPRGTAAACFFQLSVGEGEFEELPVRIEREIERRRIRRYRDRRRVGGEPSRSHLVIGTFEDTIVIRHHVLQLVGGYETLRAGSFCFRCRIGNKLFAVGSERKSQGEPAASHGLRHLPVRLHFVVLGFGGPESTTPTGNSCGRGGLPHVVEIAKPQMHPAPQALRGPGPISHGDWHGGKAAGECVLCILVLPAIVLKRPPTLVPGRLRLEELGAAEGEPLLGARTGPPSSLTCLPGGEQEQQDSAVRRVLFIALRLVGRALEIHPLLLEKTRGGLNSPHP